MVFFLNWAEEKRKCAFNILPNIFHQNIYASKRVHDAFRCIACCADMLRESYAEPHVGPIHIDFLRLIHD